MQHGKSIHDNWSMRVVIQRVASASVEIEKQPHAAIQQGLLVLVGVATDDEWNDADWLCEKIVNLRIFDDPQGVMNCSVLDVKAQLLVVSQFTLHASTKKGNRPSYTKAAAPTKASQLYLYFCQKLKNRMGDENVSTGVFAASMQVALVNNGPVTIIIDSKQKE